MPVFDPSAHPQWCSVLSADEPLPGTAAHELTWVLLENPGGWGRDVLDGEALGHELSIALKAHLAAAGARLLFIRHPGREGRHVERPQLFVCHTPPGRRLIRAVTVTGPADLLGIDLTPEGTIRGSCEVGAPLALVCTHGRRDQCCAVRGRPVAAELDQLLGGRLSAADPDAGVWECSHTGGHRFAPILLLPGSGYTYGSGSAADYARVVDEAMEGRVVADGLRGRSCWPPAGQVAEVAVRALPDVAAGPDELVVHVDPGAPHESVVEHTDGRSWHVVAARTELPERPASCGKAPAATWGWVVESVRPR